MRGEGGSPRLLGAFEGGVGSLLGVVVGGLLCPPPRHLGVPPQV